IETLLRRVLRGVQRSRSRGHSRAHADRRRPETAGQQRLFSNETGNETRRKLCRRITATLGLRTGTCLISTLIWWKFNGARRPMAPSDVSSAMVAGLVDVEQSRLSTLGCQARTILDFFDGPRVRISFVGSIYRYLATQAIARLDPAPQ